MGMKNRFQEAIQNVQRQRHLARRSVAMVLVLAMLTAMSVSWRLHQDGIALAADDTRYYCGKEEHKHTDDCYIEGTEPICGYEEGEIVEETMDSADDAGDGDSSAADWDEAGSEPESEPATQEEPEPEVVLHHHTADCYEEEEVLTCGIESDHVHQDYCYDQETGELLCTEHEHTDDCYTLEEVLVCGQEEGEPEKTDDGAALYDVDENSAEESDSAEEPETAADPEPEKEATKPETDDEIDTGYTVHHHTAECYGKVLICGKEEHEHTAACLDYYVTIDMQALVEDPLIRHRLWREALFNGQGVQIELGAVGVQKLLFRLFAVGLIVQQLDVVVKHQHDVCNALH